MKLYYDRKSKNPTYFIQAGYRNGSKTTTRNVKTIGKHQELLEITPDPLAYARNEVEKYNREYAEKKAELTLKVDFDEKLTSTGNVASKSTLLNIGYFFLQQIYHDLGVRDFFRSVQTGTKATFDCDEINRFLTFARILDPKSKWGTYDDLGGYYERPAFEYQHILRFMDVLENNFDGYIEHLYENSGRVVPRDTSVCYYDCTNYYFEAGGQDEDYVDPVTGEVLAGLRRYGVSKDHKPNPLVQMGLFMDSNGIPMSMCIRPGNANEQTSAIPLAKKITRMLKGKPFIYCADAGLGSFSIREYQSMGGRAFVVTQSIKNLSEALQSAVFNDYCYRRLSDGAAATIAAMKGFDRFKEENLALYNDVVYKVLHADKAVDLGLYEERTLKNGSVKMVKSKATMKQNIIITFSRKSMEYQRHIRNSQVARARNIIDHKNVEDAKKGPNDVRRFIKRTSVGKDGEKASDHYEINQALVDAEEKYDGYYAVATNLDDDVATILGINHNRYKIEDCFRVLKTNFRSRPVYHGRRDRIIAHFMVCYTALLIYRLLETKLDTYGTHFTTDNILETLRNMMVANIQDLYYVATYTSSEVCTALNGIFGLGLDRKNYLPKDLNKKLRNISK